VLLYGGEFRVVVVVGDVKVVTRWWRVSSDGVAKDLSWSDGGGCD
jgi:hypothetical protein